MKVTLLCSDPEHPINTYLKDWMARADAAHQITLARKKVEALGGDILFLISCSELIGASDRARYGVCLVLHASDLPAGRGWSPHIRELSEGAGFLTLTMLEAEDRVDSGRIWKKTRIDVPRHMLWDEINHLLFSAELEMLDYAIANFDEVTPEPQLEAGASYYSRRTPADSQIDPAMSIADQFDLIRVCDPNRFPAYFDHLGHRYLLKIEKVHDS